MKVLFQSLIPNDFTFAGPPIYRVEFNGFIGASNVQELSSRITALEGSRYIYEKKFYRVDGFGAYDPISLQADIVDIYLIGKIVTGVFKEGFRYLIPGLEYTNITNGVRLLGGLVFSPNEAIMLEVKYLP